MESYGGVTNFVRAPAEGRWHNGGETEDDDTIVMEVMADKLFPSARTG